MEKFTTLTAVAAYYPRANVDTDLIIRVERCAKVEKNGLGKYAFEMARFLADGSDNPEFPLNNGPFREAQILVGNINFGCGSSREMAVWAIAGLGIRCVIAPSFGEIFFGNCFQNGLLPVILPQAAVEKIGAALAADPANAKLTVDLSRQVVVAPDGSEHAFAIEPLRKKALLEGLDEIGLTRLREPEIVAFQDRDRVKRPWIYV
ncbi:MAG: 3-isopropylmalate dehydratase small subunit [Betaproteobacteria bacterium]|nr:3-isopropylmalate dehydratase small subunit [Betaproteobacteria bacterium]